MDIIGVYVAGDMIATFVNMFTVVIALDFVCNFAQLLRMR